MAAAGSMNRQFSSHSSVTRECSEEIRARDVVQLETRQYFEVASVVVRASSYFSALVEAQCIRMDVLERASDEMGDKWC